MIVSWVQAIVSVTEHETGGGLLSIADLPPQCGGGQVGVTPLLHFLYKSPTRGQVIMPAFDAPLDRQFAAGEHLPVCMPKIVIAWQVILFTKLMCTSSHQEHLRTVHY